MKMLKICFLFMLLELLTKTIPAWGQDCSKAVRLYNQGTLSSSFTEKERLFKKAIPFCKEPEVLSRIYNNLADAYEKENRLSQALTFYKKALKTKSDLATASFSAADIFYHLKDYYSAYVLYEKGLRLQPEDEISLLRIKQAEKKYQKNMVIYFNFNSFEIDPRYKQRLNKIGNAIVSLDSQNIKDIRIVGHTCDLGPGTYNRKLSLKRAEAVARYLKANFAINSQHVMITGKGESALLLPNHDRNSRTLNRRVNVIVIRYPEKSVKVKIQTSPEINFRAEHQPGD
ncbi:MAG: OmpA family protein [Desulfobacterales bacterium]|nr:OmpA family protein [Desulfobacterales bacterium]